jgi:hypothetical protein
MQMDTATLTKQLRNHAGRTHKKWVALCGEAAAAIDGIEQALTEEIQIVDRVWNALGISDYKQAKPFAIGEHIVNLRDALTKAEQRIEKLEKVRELSQGLRKSLWLDRVVIKIADQLDDILADDAASK